MYRIEDWAGNVMFNDKRFKTFEDGWDYIYEHIEDKDNAYDDVFVVIIKNDVKVG